MSKFLRNINTGVVNEVPDHVAEHFTKFEPEDYEVVDGTEEGAAVIEEAIPVDLNELTHPQLQKMAKELDVPANGTKAEIIERILAKKAEGAE